MDLKIEIRNARKEDLDSVLLVEEEAWPEEARAPRTKFEERLKTFPEGFFVAFLNDKIVGATTSQIINYDPKNPPNSWTEITADGHISRTNNPKGNCIYVVSLGVSPNSRINGKSPGIGTKLLEQQKNLTKELNLNYLVLSSRVPGYDLYYRQNKEIPIDIYISLNRDDKLPVDKELRFYQRLGLRPVKICPNTMDDKESRNYGVIMEWKHS